MATTPTREGKEQSATTRKLFENNRRWAAKVKQETPEFFSTLAQQQSPKYLWIGCSDSRVPVRAAVIAPPRLYAPFPHTQRPQRLVIGLACATLAADLRARCVGCRSRPMC
jgi:hypothetical protein